MWSWLSDGWSRLPAVRSRFRVGTGGSRSQHGGTRGGRPGGPESDGSLQRIAAEFERARRYDRSVSVAVFSLDAAEAGAPDGTAGGGHASSTVHLCPVVRQAMRETDLVVCDPVSRRCVVVMPEIGAEEGQRAVSRMRELCAAQLRCPVRGDLAVFPRDGWVFPNLVEVAEKQARATSGGVLVSREALSS